MSLHMDCDQIFVNNQAMLKKHEKNFEQVC